MSEIVILSGSPAEVSRTNLVLHYLGSVLKENHFSVTHLSVRDVPLDVLFHGKFDSPAINDISIMLQEAKGVIVGSPVYKGAYAGVLKALLDILPPDVLQDTPVLPLMTGGSPSHLLAMEYTLKPLLATLKGQNLKGVYLIDKQISKENHDSPIIEDSVLERLTKQLDYFIKTVNKQIESVI